MDIESKAPARFKRARLTNYQSLVDATPAACNVPQPDWLKRQALFKTKRLTNRMRISKSLEFDVARQFLSSMFNTMRYECEWSMYISGAANMRTNAGVVCRHQGSRYDESNGTNIPWVSFANDAASDTERVGRHNIGQSGTGIETVYSPWSAAYFEGQSLINGYQLPKFKKTTSGDPLNTIRTVQDAVNSAYGVLASVSGPYAFHNQTRSPWFATKAEIINGYTYVIPITNSGDPDNLLDLDDMRKSLRQRHKDGGIEFNFINNGAWPQVVDIITYKCKKNAAGSDELIAAAPNNEDPPVYPSTSLLNYQKAYEPVVNIVNNNTQSFNQWKAADSVGHRQMEMNTLQASHDMTLTDNVHTQPTWKFLASYGGPTKSANNITEEEEADSTCVTLNYREIGRERVVIPISGSYIHTTRYGGMDYSILDRQNRGMFQDSTNPNTKCISDIPGETIVHMISVSGVQQPASYTEGELQVVQPCMGTPGADLLVKVREFEELQPFVEISRKSRRAYIKGLQLLPADAVIDTINLPMTQWTQAPPT